MIQIIFFTILTFCLKYANLLTEDDEDLKKI